MAIDKVEAERGVHAASVPLGLRVERSLRLCDPGSLKRTEVRAPDEHGATLPSHLAADSTDLAVAVRWRR